MIFFSCNSSLSVWICHPYYLITITTSSLPFAFLKGTIPNKRALMSHDANLFSTLWCYALPLSISCTTWQLYLCDKDTHFFFLRWIFWSLQHNETVLTSLNNWVVMKWSLNIHLYIWHSLISNYSHQGHYQCPVWHYKSNNLQHHFLRLYQKSQLQGSALLGATRSIYNSAVYTTKKGNDCHIYLLW